MTERDQKAEQPVDHRDRVAEEPARAPDRTPTGERVGDESPESHEADVTGE